MEYEKIASPGEFNAPRVADGMTVPAVKSFTHKVIHKRCELFRERFQMNGLRWFLAICDEYIARAIG